MSKIESIVREHLCKALARPTDQGNLLNLNENLGLGYGLSSLDLIMLMSGICTDAAIPLTELSENDIGALHTPSDIVQLLSLKPAQDRTSA